MTTPTVTELPLRLEPTTPDSFLDGEAEVASAPAVLRELDSRRNDGIEVRLLWNQTTDQAVVAVVDARTGDAFDIDVARQEARDAFNHPYAYAASRGVNRRS